MWFWHNSSLLLEGISFGKKKKTSPVCYQEVEFTENITFLQYLAPGYCSINKLVRFETKCTIFYNIPACRFVISWCDSISTVGSLSS